jgi:lantibiotic biosynthesis protein
MKADGEHVDGELRLFQVAPIALLRAPILPYTAAAEALEVSDEPDCSAKLADYIRALWEDARFREAVAAASPDFAAAVERVLQRARPLPKVSKVRRVAVSLTKYHLRMSSRPTPFGLMAGVTVARFGEGLARLGDGHKSWTRPDMAWLMALVANLEADVDILPHLRVMASPEPTVRRLGLGEEAAIGAARDPVPFADAVTAVERACGQPGGPGGGMDAFSVVRRLVAEQVLLTDLRPPPSRPDPLCYVLGRLASLSDHPFVSELHAIGRGIIEFDEQRAGSRTTILASLETRMRALHCAERTLHTDLALDADVRLPPAVKDEIARAAEVLWHMTSVPPGKPYLRAYHKSFLARYGTDRLVPLPEVLSPGTGLGIPLPQPRRSAGATTNVVGSESDITRLRALMRVTAHARKCRIREVVVDDTLLDELRLSSQEYRHAPTSAEVYAELLSPSLSALCSGDFRLVIANVPREPAGASFGRFAYLLGEETQGVLQLFRTGGTYGADAERADLMYWPRNPELANVALVPPGLDRYIPAGARDPDAQDTEIPFSELALGANAERLYVVSAKTGREVVPTQLHVVNTRQQAPDTARFLHDLGSEGIRTWWSWNWGPFQSAEFLPRLRYGKTVLHPATWRLDAATVAAARNSSFPGWREVLDTWRARSGSPRRVLLRNRDQRIPLDLGSPIHLHALQQEVASGRRFTLTELPGGEDYADSWLVGPDGPHHAEVIFALRRREIGRPASAVRRPGQVRIRQPGAGLHDPGGEWLYAKIYAPAHYQAEILSGRLRPAIHELLDGGYVDRWFYIRFIDSAPHIRLRFHGQREVIWGHVLGEVQGWMRDLRGSGLASSLMLDSYDQELERYGGPEAISYAEEAFAADSIASLDLLNMIEAGRIDIVPLLASALSITNLLQVLAPGSDIAQFLNFSGTSTEYRDSFAAQKRDAVELVDPSGSWDLLRRRPWGPEMIKIWERRKPSLEAYRTQIEGLMRGGRCWTEARRIFGSFLHMHCNRLFGMDRSDELRAYAIIVNALRSQEARRQAEQRCLR